MFRLILTFLPSLLIGFVIANACFKRSGIGAFILKCSISAGLCIGICSLLYLLLLPIHPSLWVVLAIEFGFLIISIVVFYLLNRFTLNHLFAVAKPNVVGANKSDSLTISMLVYILFVLSSGNVLLSFITLCLTQMVVEMLGQFGSLKLDLFIAVRKTGQ